MCTWQESQQSDVAIIHVMEDDFYYFLGTCSVVQMLNNKCTGSEILCEGAWLSLLATKRTIVVSACAGQHFRCLSRHLNQLPEDIHFEVDIYLQKINYFQVLSGLAGQSTDDVEVMLFTVITVGYTTQKNLTEISNFFPNDITFTNKRRIQI